MKWKKHLQTSKTVITVIYNGEKISPTFAVITFRLFLDGCPDRFLDSWVREIVCQFEFVSSSVPQSELLALSLVGLVRAEVAEISREHFQSVVLEAFSAVFAVRSEIVAVQSGNVRSDLDEIVEEPLQSAADGLVKIVLAAEFLPRQVEALQNDGNRQSVAGIVR